MVQPGKGDYNAIVGTDNRAVFYVLVLLMSKDSAMKEMLLIGRAYARKMLRMLKG